MSLEDILDKFIWGGFEIAERLPFHWLRFFGIFVAWVVITLSSIIWIPIAIIIGFKDIYNYTKERK